MAKDVEPGGSRYTSDLQAATRRTAQLLLLKPALWKLLKIHVHSAANLDSLEAPFIVFSNHASHLDAPLILCSLPSRLGRFVATGAAGDFFYDKWWKSAPMSLFMNGFPIDRGKGGRGQRGLSAKLLDDGVPLLLFPEGTRSRDGAMGPYKPGVASLCISRGVPALPVALVGAFEAWPSKQKHLPKGRPEVHVVFGRPMTPFPGEIAHEFNERMRRQVIELHDTTARAYGMKTLAEYAHTQALERAQKSEIAALVDDAKQRADKQEER
ncbi:lysophospholipid acyltransferase family protein [Tessaracoccus flavus]|uniref:1-acyl-sn-glycerol-3-phosphate acyltransferase n=1 Tax=Tessaracoccus flavus TaxID=1610493 RepID=A0A1Q2CIH0_9ACTN|nr:lysophospholipid acyltransferase family protein [Tessaracoccus flavus]AQP45850.1 1-acyl-sn-glycerol-3-phosphate acyltransferase [Tessaracoccus flavus]SDZ15347.1 1-acyl-sn-glycerol-3-phosphate acyltransferase [Tessaracoccus flavus]